MAFPARTDLSVRLRRLTAAGIVLVCASAAAVGAPVQAAPLAATANPDIPGDWHRPRASAQRPPDQVVTDARDSGALRFAVTRNLAGRLTVESRSAPNPAAARALVEQAQRTPGLLSIEPDARTIHTFEPATVAATATNDPDRNGQWALSRLKAEQVWNSTQAAGMKIAIVDTGVGHHEDLSDSRILPGTDLSGAAGDGRNDGNGHGTHCAGIIGATLNNNVGIVGLAPAVSIIPVKVLDDSGSGYDSAVAQGITWATDHGADVISLSLGGTDYTETLDLATQYALSHGVVVIAAAGNERDNGSPVEYPAALPGVVAVAATDQNDDYGSFSNAGDYVDLSAPGVGILSTVPGNQYESWSGTSMATPYVAAAAALVKARAESVQRTLAPAELAGILTSTADDLGPGGRDDDFGFGLINPLAALAAVTGTTPPPTTVAGPVAITPAVTFPAPGQARVTWSKPDADGGSPVTGYRVAVSAANSTTSFGPWSATSATAATLTGLQPGAGYRVQVVAVNAVGPSSIATGAFRQASRPTGVRAARVTAWPAPGRATVGWAVPLTNGGSPILQYLVQVSAPNSTTRFGSWQPTTTTSRTLIGLLRNATYRVRLIAVNSQGNSPAVTLVFRQGR